MAAASDPEEVLRSTPGRDNFLRVTRLLISGGTTLLKEAFDQLCPPSNLPTILQNPVTVKQLKKANLKKPQRDRLFPSAGVYGKSEEFDITLLFSLLRTICNLTPPTTGWKALPASTDHSLAADLARINNYRNKVYAHVNQDMDITDAEFSSLWQEIREVLVRIAGKISSEKENQWRVAIASFLTKPLTAEDESNVLELKWWYRNDMELKDYVEQGFEQVRGDIKRLREEVKESRTTNNEEKSALLPITIDCTAIAAKPDPRGESPEMGGASNDVFRETQNVLNLAASKYLKRKDLPTPEVLNGFEDYMERVRKVVIVDTHTGSLIITVKCRSLQILEELWEDYRIGRVNEMAQKFLVTEDVLNELNLKEAKLTTTILEEEYIACREKLMLFSELELLKEQRNEFLNQFLYWAHTRKRTKSLLTEIVKQLRGPSLSSTGVAALVVGALAIPFTFGTSMYVGAAAAVGAGAAGTIMTRKNRMNRWETQKKATEGIVQDRKVCQELQDKVYSFKQCITDFAVFCREHIDLALPSNIDILRRIDREEFEAAKEEVLPTATVPTLLQEEVNIFKRVSTFVNQLQRSTLATNHEVLTMIQHILDELRECPNDEEIQTMVVNFIEEIFDSKLSSLGFRASSEVTGREKTESLPTPPTGTPLLARRSNKTSNQRKKAYAS